MVNDVHFENLTKAGIEVTKTQERVARINIVLGRKIMNEVLLTYLPTMLIIIIVYVTSFFKAFYFEATVTVNLTGKMK